MEKIYKNCQSCGMPLKKDEKGVGTMQTVLKVQCIVVNVMKRVPL